MALEPLVVSQASAGERLSGVLDAQLALEAARHERARRVHLMAVLSVPVAVLALFPELFSEVGRRAALTFWAFSAIAAAGALVSEWRLGRRAIRLAGRY